MSKTLFSSVGLFFLLVKGKHGLYHEIMTIMIAIYFKMSNISDSLRRVTFVLMSKIMTSHG